MPLVSWIHCPHYRALIFLHWWCRDASLPYTYHEIEEARLIEYSDVTQWEPEQLSTIT
jgi:hypothetical protein